MFLDHFDVLISKMIFKKKIYHFDIFRHYKHFKKVPQPHSQTALNEFGESFRRVEGTNNLFNVPIEDAEKANTELPSLSQTMVVKIASQLAKSYDFAS